jgi:hypothetical protein
MADRKTNRNIMAGAMIVVIALGFGGIMYLNDFVKGPAPSLTSDCTSALPQLREMSEYGEASTEFATYYLKYYPEAPWITRFEAKNNDIKLEFKVGAQSMCESVKLAYEKFKEYPLPKKTR